MSRPTPASYTSTPRSVAAKQLPKPGHSRNLSLRRRPRTWSTAPTASTTRWKLTREPHLMAARAPQAASTVTQWSLPSRRPRGEDGASTTGVEEGQEVALSTIGPVEEEVVLAQAVTSTTVKTTPAAGIGLSLNLRTLLPTVPTSASTSLQQLAAAAPQDHTMVIRTMTVIATASGRVGARAAKAIITTTAIMAELIMATMLTTGPTISTTAIYASARNLATSFTQMTMPATRPTRATATKRATGATAVAGRAIKTKIAVVILAASS